MQDSFASGVRCEPANEPVMGLRPLIAKHAALHLVSNNHIEKVSEEVNAAQFVQDDSLGIVKYGGSDLFTVFIVGMHIVFVRVSLGLAPMKGDE
jgi:hypothetical protein